MSIKPLNTSNIIQQAYAGQQHATSVGFDWPDLNSALAKVQEEFDELCEAITDNDASAIIEEYGDLLLMLINIATRFNIDPEQAISQANKKFNHRFTQLETTLAKSGKTLYTSNINQMNAIWQKIKG